MNISQILDLDACHYENHSKSQYERVKEFISSVKIHASDSILDVGCGFGNIIAEISQVAPEGRCVGIDPSPNMIHLALQKFPKSKFPNLEFYNIKAEEMNFSPKTFDVIICTNALLWIRRPHEAVELMCSYLKPGGLILILTYLNNTPYALIFQRVLEKYFPMYAHLSASNFMLSEKEHKNILIANDLKLEEFLSEEVYFQYKNSEELKNYVKGWLNCFVPLPEDLQALFLNKVVKESRLANVSTNENEIIIPHKLLIIRGRKY